MSLWKKFCQAFKKIHLVDRCLLLFMAVLFALLVFSVFTCNTSGQDLSGINTILRTSTAAIFGYFLSAHFAKQDVIECEKKSQPQAGSVQIIIATIVGLFSLFVLMAAANRLMAVGANDASHDIIATITQFRDFVSACVGFLIGTPTTPKDQS